MKKLIDIMEIVEFDFRTGKYHLIPVNETIPYNLSDELEQLKRNMGLKLFIQGVDNPEHFIKSFYQNKGYQVARLPSFYLDYQHRKYDEFPSDVKQQIVKLIETNYSLVKDGYCKTILELFDKAGVPDFIVIKVVDKKVEDFFFVEVKSSKDSLRFEQIFWIFSSNVPFKLVYCQDSKLVV